MSHGTVGIEGPPQATVTLVLAIFSSGAERLLLPKWSFGLDAI
jgi:hypothetical protein